ncbi:MAG: hypothetical protein AAGJ46_20420 [Planctomycetota bacterium]
MQLHPVPIALVVAAALPLCGGCGGSNYDVGYVTGTVTAKGKPLEDIIVKFYPDTLDTDAGPMSAGTTDAQGRYKLSYKERRKPLQEGAVVGTHRVALADSRKLSAANPDRVPTRIHPGYRSQGTTPLRKDVVPGPQEIDIEIP